MFNILHRLIHFNIMAWQMSSFLISYLLNEKYGLTTHTHTRAHRISVTHAYLLYYMQYV